MPPVINQKLENGERAKIQSIIGLSALSAFFGAFFGVVGGLVLRATVFWYRRWDLTRKLQLYSDPTHGRQLRCRVYNGGRWTIRSAVIYVALKFSDKETEEPPPGHSAFIKPDNFVPLEWDQLCWSVRAPVVNPLKVDIYAKEPQPFSPCGLTDDEKLVKIPSEEGWPHPKNEKPTMRVFLRRKDYYGFLKVVSDDTDARYFKITINFDNNVSSIDITAIP